MSRPKFVIDFAPRSYGSTKLVSWWLGVVCPDVCSIQARSGGVWTVYLWQYFSSTMIQHDRESAFDHKTVP